MANLILPDPRMEMPELLEPGRKPIGPVEVDWSHSLAKSLAQCWLFNSMRDLVHGDELTLYNDAWLGPNGLEIPSSTAGASSTNRLVDNGCIFAVAKGPDGLGYYLYDTNSARDLLILAGNGVGNMYLYSSNTSASPVLPQFMLTDERVTHGVNYGVNEYFYKGKLYRNFSDIASVGGASTMYYGTRYTLASSLIGYIECFYVFDRNLTAEEHASLSRNPYQFLIPA